VLLVLCLVTNALAGYAVARGYPTDSSEVRRDISKVVCSREGGLHCPGSSSPFEGRTR
jgi:hypothetical protein